MSCSNLIFLRRYKRAERIVWAEGCQRWHSKGLYRSQANPEILGIITRKKRDHGGGLYIDDIKGMSQGSVEFRPVCKNCISTKEYFVVCITKYTV